MHRRDAEVGASMRRRDAQAGTDARGAKRVGEYRLQRHAIDKKIAGDCNGSMPADGVRANRERSTALQHLIDLARTDAGLTLRWADQPAHTARVLDAEGCARIGVLADAVADAEKRRGLAGPVTQARRALGQAVYALFDGPERRFARLLKAAKTARKAFDLVVRLTGAEPGTHPAARWRFEVMHDGDEALFGRRKHHITLQFGDAAPGDPTVIEAGRLRILFMAFSPEDTKPVLDYEQEEDRLLRQLEPFVQTGRAVVHVVEDGSLDGLEHRLLTRAYDIVHLSGHGIMTPNGPRLVMEDAIGARDDVAPESLVRVFDRAEAMPRLVMVSTCHSANADGGMPSLIAALVAGGVPAVAGWARPVGDIEATMAAGDIYERLCAGKTPAEAIAFARRELLNGDALHNRPPSASWGTLQLVAEGGGGFRVDTSVEPETEAQPERDTVYTFLGETGQMRVLAEGFVGRRRPLQRLVRILRTGKDGDAQRGGALVVGSKGVGKSCLVGRAIERHKQEARRTELVVLHGTIDPLTLLEQFKHLAQRWQDQDAEAALMQGGKDEPVPVRIARLLRGAWAKKPLILVLDDFEKNLTVPPAGLAQMSTGAAELLEALLPIARLGKLRVVVTSTAEFALAEREKTTLAVIPLGPFDKSTVRKLWTRGREGELKSISPDLWDELATRLGRNPRILDWVRQLMAGRTPDEVRELAAKAQAELPDWSDGYAPGHAEQDRLAALFLRSFAFEEAKASVSKDALTFVQRARVYEQPVPIEGLVGLTEGLAIDLEVHLPALANLGLVQRGTLRGRSAYGVSALVEPAFRAEDPERWHGVAAAFWEGEFQAKPAMDELRLVWAHALKAGDADLAGRRGINLMVQLSTEGLYRESLTLAKRHCAGLPNDPRGLRWLGYANLEHGAPQVALPLLERAVEAAQGLPPLTLQAFYDDLGRACQANGLLGRAAECFQRSLALLRGETDADTRNSETIKMHELAGVLRAQGELGEARVLLERSLAIWVEVLGTERHPSVATSMHELAGVLQAQGELGEARVLLERSLAIKAEVLGTERHPEVAASMHALAGVLRAQGELGEARVLLERSLAIWVEVLGTERHPSVAASTSELATVMFHQKDFDGALKAFRSARTILEAVLGTTHHPDIATVLNNTAHVYEEKGDLDAACSTFKEALDIREAVFGTMEHYQIAENEVPYGGLLIRIGRVEEGVAHLKHALAVFEAAVPNHPYVSQLKQIFRAQG